MLILLVSTFLYMDGSGCSNNRSEGLFVVIELHQVADLDLFRFYKKTFHPDISNNG